MNRTGEGESINVRGLRGYELFAVNELRYLNPNLHHTNFCYVRSGCFDAFKQNYKMKVVTFVTVNRNHIIDDYVNKRYNLDVLLTNLDNSVNQAYLGLVQSSSMFKLAIMPSLATPACIDKNMYFCDQLFVFGDQAHALNLSLNGARSKNRGFYINEVNDGTAKGFHQILS